MHMRLPIALAVLLATGLGHAQQAAESPEDDASPRPSSWGSNAQLPDQKYREGRDDPSFMFCTISYQGNGTREPLGFGWPTDYPDAGFNLMLAVAENTGIEVAWEAEGEPEQTILGLKDPGLKDFPLIFMSDVGTAGFSEEERKRLRAYLLGGGVLHADDFWGSRAWKNWEYEIGKVLPPDEYPIKDIPADHAILHKPFKVGQVPQIPSVQFWAGTGGASGTSERGRESREPHLRGIWDKDGRLMVVMSFNTDLGDSWTTEDEGGTDYYGRFSRGGGYALGINIVSYAMGAR